MKHAQPLTRADLASLKPGDRLFIEAYDADGEEEYIDHTVEVMDVVRDARGNLLHVEWLLEHPDYGHAEELDVEILEEMLESLYRLQ